MVTAPAMTPAEELRAAILGHDQRPGADHYANATRWRLVHHLDLWTMLALDNPHAAVTRCLIPSGSGQPGPSDNVLRALARFLDELADRMTKAT